MWLATFFSRDPKLMKAAVYGANDGIITTFAVVAGVAGASLPSQVVIILGIANMIADGLSMGLGDFLGERSERKLRKQLSAEQSSEKIWKTGLTTFIAFVLAGSFPLIPYFLSFAGVPLPIAPFILSIFATAGIQFALGSARSFFTKGNWWVEGLEMLGIGLIAASVAFFLGSFVEQLLR